MENYLSSASVSCRRWATQQIKGASFKGNCGVDSVVGVIDKTLVKLSR